MTIATVVKWLAVAAMIAGLLFGIQFLYEQWRSGVFEEGSTAGSAKIQKLWDEDRDRAKTAAIAQARANALETERRLLKQKEAQDAQTVQLAQAHADNERLSAAIGSLRERADAYLDASGCRALVGDPATVCILKAAAALRDALVRSAEIARRVAAEADEARARGLKCEADYDSLTVAK